jgi:hypothetical protein
MLARMVAKTDKNLKEMKEEMLANAYSTYVLHTYDCESTSEIRYYLLVSEDKFGY